MQDLQAKLEKLLLEAEDCELIAKLATDIQKRAFFARLAKSMRSLARDVEQQIAAKTANSNDSHVKTG